ncbi:carbohydrate ABC transporter permease [Streptomyces sp. CMB-StM0423]|uniref:carbohydrate ABC transporter permease n=1 Tax=Streptomyces sp. CMB-StM0423 TaxID=2059884 RepID=UPI000C7088A8|nr:sugar ABC transporter permease [Streptomyces sp. CMB-StM0423]AUH44179.1 permease [Streptomyces sp. CMB-StM0423]
MTDTVGTAEAAKPVRLRRRIPVRSPHQAAKNTSTRRMGGPFAGVPWALPALALVGVLLVYPFLRSIYGSFFEDNGFTSSFTGIDNYTRLAEDPIFGRSLLNTFMWVAGTLLLPVVAGLAIAVATHRMRRFGGLAQLVIVLPFAISGAATAALWRFMLTTDGAVNEILRGVGLDSWAQSWLLEWPQNTISMIVASTWQATGLNVVLFAIGLRAIPRETIEAAELDGATGWRMFRHITLPQLRAVTVVVVGMAIVNSLKAFDMIWVLTQGGPSRSSETLALTMYREAFRLFHVGYGSAIALVLSVIVVASSWLYLRRQMPGAKD